MININELRKKWCGKIADFNPLYVNRKPIKILDFKESAPHTGRIIFEYIEEPFTGDVEVRDFNPDKMLEILSTLTIRDDRNRESDSFVEFKKAYRSCFKRGKACGFFLIKENNHRLQLKARTNELCKHTDMAIPLDNYLWMWREDDEWAEFCKNSPIEQDDSPYPGNLVIFSKLTKAIKSKCDKLYIKDNPHIQECLCIWYTMGCKLANFEILLGIKNENQK